EVLVAVQRFEDRLWDGADADLEAVAVVDQPRDVVRDRPLELADLRRVEGEERVIYLAGDVDLRDVDPVAGGAWRPAVDLGNDQRRLRHQVERDADRGTKRTVAARVGRRDL